MVGEDEWHIWAITGQNVVPTSLQFNLKCLIHRKGNKKSLDSSPDSAKKLVKSLKQVTETPWAFVASSSMMMRLQKHLQ